MIATDEIKGKPKTKIMIIYSDKNNTVRRKKGEIIELYQVKKTRTLCTIFSKSIWRSAVMHDLNILS